MAGPARVGALLGGGESFLGSLADVAEAMRIALVENHPHLIESYIKELWHLAEEPSDMAELIYLGPEDKIRAAMLAWECNDE